MTWLDALILGIVQGVTEFFPVSSSGHLVIGQELLGLRVPGILFDVAVHVATLVSVLVVYREKLGRLIAGIFRKGEDGSWRYILKLGVATIPAAVVGLSLQDWFEVRFDDPIFAATMILVTGSIVWSSRWALGTQRIRPLELVPIVVAAAISIWAGTILPFLGVLALELVVMGVARLSAPRETGRIEPTWGGAVMMGIAQAVAIFPGISRSGSTVITGLWRRIDPVAAAEFSFLMSIPAILGAALLQLPEAMETGFSVAPNVILVGFLAASISGVLAIRFFVALLRRQNFYVFAYYCWAAAFLFLLFERA
jgi:undecaprenyl-diphosphatase